MVVHNNKRVLVAPDSLDKELNAETAAVPTLDHELDLTGEDSAYGAVVVDADSRSVATGVAVIELGDRSFSVDLEEYRDSPWSNVENPIVRDAILAGAVLPRHRQDKIVWWQETWGFEANSQVAQVQGSQGDREHREESCHRKCQGCCWSSACGCRCVHIPAVANDGCWHSR